MRKSTTLLMLASAASITFAVPTYAEERETFRVGYVVYVGFMPLAWMQAEGVMEEWGDKYGIDVELVQVNDYIGSINQFMAGDLDAVAVASMDALTIPAVGGIDTSVFLLADYSDGNDMLLSRSADTVTDLLDDEVWLLQYSVSHYLLNRALSSAGVTEPWRVKSVNISDAEIAAAYITQPEMNNVAAWNPMATTMLQEVPETKVLFDSSQIPGEIMDVFIARTSTLAESPDFAKSFTGAWYEAMETMAAETTKEGPMHSLMAAAMGTDLEGLAGQADQTHFFTTPGEAAEFLSSEATQETVDLIRTFSFEQGLFGQGVSSVDEIGIEVRGEILGSPENVKLRFDPSFSEMAASGDL